MKFNKKFYEKYGYKVTDEPLLPSELSHLAQTFERLHRTVSESTIVSGKTIAELEDLIQRYPTALSFQNYLYIAYIQNKQKQKAVDYLQEMIKKHPDYVFGKLNLAGFYLTDGHFNRAADTLKEPYDIRNVEQGEFIHQSALFSYYNLAIRIELKRNNIAKARELHRILFDYDKNNTKVKEVADLIFASQASFFPNMDASNEREVASISKPISGHFLSDGQGNPIFNHHEINQLYKYSLKDIPNSVIESILALPRQTLIQDLEHVLCDTVLRNDYFMEKDDWADETHNFTIHAVYLLTELRAYESLSRVLDVMRQDNEFCDYWFADWIEDYFNEPVYILGEKQLDVLKDFVLEENLYPWFRLMATDTVAQVALKQPERRAEVINWSKEILHAHLDNPNNDNLIDSTFLGMFINDLVMMRAIELKDEITQLYENGWVSDFDNGKLSDVLKELDDPFEPYDIKPLPDDIFELYNKKYFDRRAEYQSKVGVSDFTKSMNDPYETYMRDLAMSRITNALDKKREGDDYYDDDWDDDENQNHRWTPQFPVKREDPKVGRNDPCPCGSGKKYKKCHGK